MIYYYYFFKSDSIPKDKRASIPGMSINSPLADAPIDGRNPSENLKYNDDELDREDLESPRNIKNIWKSMKSVTADEKQTSMVEMQSMTLREVETQPMTVDKKQPPVNKVEMQSMTVDEKQASVEEVETQLRTVHKKQPSLDKELFDDELLRAVTKHRASSVRISEV